MITQIGNIISLLLLKMTTLKNLIVFLSYMSKVEK